MIHAFKKQPLELYGNVVASTTSAQMATACASEQCPQLHKRCVKQRKSNASQTIGSCIVGYQDQPLIICPHRFLAGNQIFHDAIPLLVAGLEYGIISEIPMPGGNIDYFLIGTNNGTIKDYAGIEIQSLDTTGSGAIWQAREDVLQGAMLDAYGYGINWKMSAKTILMQLHHKALAFEALHKKLVLVLQQAFFEYMRHEFQTDHIHDAEETDAVHFHMYDMSLQNGAFDLHLVERKSTDILGIERMLTLGRAAKIMEEDVLARIQGRMTQAIRL